MSRVILLLPDPDRLQLANCYKYITRKENPYSEIYTMSTIAGRCANVEKLLIIGHGGVGTFVGATIGEVVDAIIDSGMPLTGGGKIAFDTCYAGSRGDAGNVTSALEKVLARLKTWDPACNLVLVGSTGPTVTIGPLGSKRLVVKHANLDHASQLQDEKMEIHRVNPSGDPMYWREDARSDEIKLWARFEYTYLIAFAIDFREALAVDLDHTAQRKVKLQA
ncbi:MULTISPECIES: hypothetical protein [unclassified Duganella]|uniref:hypothetical protein n=1 Tax=unclassified Duganella TaxID=2636909 RepID=UPI0011C0CDF5|nr:MULTISPECIES: hypothetical protein [unclassified Duganella]